MLRCHLLVHRPSIRCAGSGTFAALKGPADLAIELHMGYKTILTVAWIAVLAGLTHSLLVKLGVYRRELPASLYSDEKR